MADRGASAEELLEVLLSSCEDAAVGPAIAAAALSLADPKAPTHDSRRPHRTRHPKDAFPGTPQPSQPTHHNAQTEADRPLRRSLVAAELLGLVLARYVLRLEPLATAPRDRVISGFAPALAAHLSDPHH